MATLADISKRTGYSLATISRVANGLEGVRPEVRAAVEQAIHELGYIARRPREDEPASLVEVVIHRRATNELISRGQDGLDVAPPIAPDAETLLTAPWRLGNDFYRRILAGIQDELVHHGRQALLGVVQDLARAEVGSRSTTTGVLVMGEGGPGLDRFIARCRLPVVLVDILHDGAADQVTTDNVAGVGQAIEHLAGLGHRRIGYIRAGDQPTQRDRNDAFAFHASRRGVAAAAPWDAIRYDSIDATARALVPLLARADRPSAIVCAHDYAAIALLRAAQQAGLTVPRDLSVIGFDDVEAAALVTPALTTVRVAAEEIGRQAVRQLAGCRGACFPARRGCVVRMPTSLVVRASTAAPAAR